jgi:hypothetical protein
MAADHENLLTLSVTSRDAMNEKRATHKQWAEYSGPKTRRNKLIENKVESKI